MAREERGEHPLIEARHEFLRIVGRWDGYLGKPFNSRLGDARTPKSYWYERGFREGLGRSMKERGVEVDIHRITIQLPAR